MEFNADGSLKLSGSVNKKFEDDLHKMSNTRCVKITRNITRTFSPKLCTLTIEASPHVDPNFVEKTFGFFSRRVDSTVKFTKLSSSEFQVTVGGEFSRCRDCMLLSYMFREYLNGNIIEKKGTCSFMGGSNLF